MLTGWFSPFQVIGDHKLNWHEGHIWPEDAILEDLLKEISL